MTTIVASRAEMAADRKVVDGDTNYHTRKICRLGQSLVGAAGDNSAIVKFFRWLEKGGKVKPPTFSDDEDFEGIVLNPSGLFVYDKSCQPDEVVDSFYAIGSGKQAALAAMHMGASPTKAVEVACLVDNSSGGPVDSLSLK